MQGDALIHSHAGVLMILSGIAAFFFWFEKRSGWRIFNFVPPLVFIYMIPMVLSNSGVIPLKSPVYSQMSTLVLPLFLVLMLLDVNVVSTIKVMGRGVLVMLAGTAGVVIGAPVAFFFVSKHLGPDAWKGFGALAGSWIGGTGNMAAVAEGLGTSPSDYGLAVLADNAVYLLWLPILLGSKLLAGRFNRFTGVSEEKVARMKEEAGKLSSDKGRIEMRHLLSLLALGFLVTWLSEELSLLLPVVKPVLSAKTWKILLVTSAALLLSLTPARKIPGSRSVSMALVYMFVANMGAKADVSEIFGQAPWFILGAYIWIFVHGTFCVIAAKLLKVDIHTAAISSAANIGGAASAPVVAAYHDKKLVPVSILMALVGYAIGNYAAFLAAQLCFRVSLL